MLRLLTRKARKPAPARPRYFRPGLERLERRDCPAGPTITMFSVTAGTGKTAMIMGQVTENSPTPAPFTVALGGVVTANLTTDGSGNFSATEPASALGTVTATATDAQGQTSAPAQAQLTSQAPSITVTVLVLDHRNVMVIGKVTAPSPGGLTVTITGQASGTTTTAADGTFNIELQASALGNVSASTKDIRGQASNVATATIQASAPVLSQFQATQNGTTWTFTGQVTACDAPGMTVTFGGIPQLQGQTVTVGKDDTFSFSITLPAGLDATATAFVTDWWGQQSNTEGASVMS